MMGSATEGEKSDHKSAAENAPVVRPDIQAANANKLTGASE